MYTLRLNYRKFLVVILGFTLTGITIYILIFLHVALKAEIDSKTKSDAILVLGARSYIDGKYNPCLEARVTHAAELYKNGYASKIIVTGGDDKEDRVNEAETMKKIAEENGVLSKDILMEKAATSTYENFILSQRIMEQKGLGSIIIVSEPFHIARASLVAQKLRIAYTVSPAIESSCWQPNKYFSKFFFKEPFAILVYKLQNKF